MFHPRGETQNSARFFGHFLRTRRRSWQLDVNIGMSGPESFRNHPEIRQVLSFSHEVLASTPGLQELATKAGVSHLSHFLQTTIGIIAGKSLRWMSSKIGRLFKSVLIFSNFWKPVSSSELFSRWLRKIGARSLPSRISASSQWPISSRRRVSRVNQSGFPGEGVLCAEMDQSWAFSLEMFRNYPLCWLRKGISILRY